MIEMETFQFFKANAGGQVGYAAVGALQLARAEDDARALGLKAEWGPEPEPDLSWCARCEHKARGNYYHGGPKQYTAGPEHAHEVLQLLIRSPKGAVLAALGNIVDPDAAYRRVCEAEQFAEAVAQVKVWRCLSCGSADVQAPGWLHLNSDAVDGDDGADLWCGGCETHGIHAEEFENGERPPIAE